MKIRTVVVSTILFVSIFTVLISYGNQKAEWKGQGPGEIQRIHIVKINSQDNILISDTGNMKILELDKEGTLIKEAKVINIPKKVEIEENIFKENLINNLSSEEVYMMGNFYIIDDNIYMTNTKPPEIIKLNLLGRVVGRVSRRGQGPGEFQFVVDIKEFKNNIILMAPYSLRMIIYDKDLRFIGEFKVKKQYMGFLVNKRNELIMKTGSRPGNTYYFEVCSDNGKFLRRFSIKKERRPGVILTFDYAAEHVYIPEEDSFWVAMRKRYALQYYKGENLKVEIRANKGFFKGVEEEMGGISYTRYLDRSKLLALIHNKLLHFYRKDKQTFCDIFDRKSYQFERRIKCKQDYRSIAHHKNNIFYALCYDENKDILLYRIVL